MSEISEIVAATAESLSADAGESNDESVNDAPSDDSGESGTDDSVADPEPEPEAPAEPEPTPAAEAPKASDDDDLKALEKELTAKNPKLAKGRIPVSRHQAVVERTRRLAQAERDAAVADARKAYESYESPEFRAKIQALTLAETSPKQFLSDVLLKTPAYQRLMEEIVQERMKGVTPAPKDEVDEGPPKPNYLYPDGVTLGYDAEGQQRLIEYQRRQAVREATKSAEAKIAEIQAQVNETLQPIITAQQAQKNLAESTARVAPIYQAAIRWPGFKDYENDIRVEMNKPAYDGLSAQQALERAYDAVVPGRLQVKEETRVAELKAQWVKEMNDKARARSMPTPGALPSATGSSEPQSIADIVAATNRRLSA
jgi:hypothetical protein